MRRQMVLLKKKGPVSICFLFISCVVKVHCWEMERKRGSKTKTKKKKENGRKGDSGEGRGERGKYLT